MEFLFKGEAEKDLIFWHQNDKSVIRKIESIFRDMNKNPFFGLGKPEPLKGNLSGYWSRRINKEHRIIYTVKNDVITIYSLRGHYTKK